MCFAVLLALGSAQGEASADDARMMVSATVLKHARLSLLSQPTSLVITAADVSRGYVEVAAPTELAIQSNSLDGYALEFLGDGDKFRQIIVTGLSRDVQMEATGGLVIQPTIGPAVTRITLRLGYRFALASLTQPGVYSWPLRLSVIPQ